MWTLIKLLFWVTLGAAAAVVFAPEFLPELTENAQEVLSSGGAGTGEEFYSEATSREEMFPEGLGGGDPPHAGPAQGLEPSSDRRQWEREVREKLRRHGDDPVAIQREMDKAYNQYRSASYRGDRVTADESYRTYEVCRDALEILRQRRGRPWR